VGLHGLHLGAWGLLVIVTGKGVVEWVAKRTNEFGSFGTDIGIGWSKNGELVAGVAYAEWNGPNVVCHIAAVGKTYCSYI